MENPSIDPQEAATKCTASFEIAGSYHDGDPEIYQDVGNYVRLVAKPGSGWDFKRFKWDYYRSWSSNITDLNSSGENKRQDGNYVYPPDGEAFTSSRFRYLKEGKTTYLGEYSILPEDIYGPINCVAVFEKKIDSGLILCNLAGVILHGKNGTILYDD